MNRPDDPLGGVPVAAILNDDPPPIDVAAGTELSVEIDGVFGQFKSTLVGQRDGRYLIIRTPLTPPGITTKLFRGNKVMVHYLEEGRTCSFESTILVSINDPDPLLFLAWPSLIEEKSLRGARRIDTYIACVMAVRDKVVEGIIIDLSVSGCRCLVPTHLPGGLLHLHLGDLLLIEASVGGRAARLQGKIRNVEVLHTSAQVGIHFEHLRPETEQQVVDFLISQGIDAVPVAHEGAP